MVATAVSVAVAVAAHGPVRAAQAVAPPSTAAVLEQQLRCRTTAVGKAVLVGLTAEVAVVDQLADRAAFLAATAGRAS